VCRHVPFTLDSARAYSTSAAGKAATCALVAVMIGLAAVETTSGYYDYFVSGPERRAEVGRSPRRLSRIGS
jgi:hypothetical protein